MSKVNKKILKFSDFASTHAEKRAQGRTKHRNIEILIKYSDRMVHLPEKKVNKTVKAYSFTEKKLRSLVKNGIIDQQTSDKCKNLVILITNDYEVTTVLHQRNGKQGRVYRKNIKNYRDRYFKK